MKIQSISDVITNSSTEVFIVYNEENLESIKNLVNSILAIDGHYTFDDLFTIRFELDSWYAQEWMTFKNTTEGYPYTPLYDKYKDLSIEELEHELLTNDELYNALLNDYKEFRYEEIYSIDNVINGISVKAKYPENTKAAELITGITDIFDLGYSYD